MSSIKFNNVYLNDKYTIAGPLEKIGQIKTYDETFDDYYFEEKTFELAEIKMQRKVINNLLAKNNKIELIIGGDLSNQIAISNYTMRNYKLPFLGIYNACASFVESMIIASNMIDSKKINNIICVTSSHNLNAEKQFRYPVEYGSPKKQTSTFTTTGSAGITLSNIPSNIKIESATIGKVIDLGSKDVNHFGACMAPAAADTIKRHLDDLKRNADYYDLILTGDLGKIGLKILKEYFKEYYHIEIKNIDDAGKNIFANNQNVNAGASGPVTLPLVFLTKVLKVSKYKKILLVATGALHSPSMINQKETIPAIAHAISIEVI